MSITCLKSFFILILFFILLSNNPVFATHKCGNGVCQPSNHHNESCSTCPADCGACPAPTYGTPSYGTPSYETPSYPTPTYATPSYTTPASDDPSSPIPTPLPGEPTATPESTSSSPSDSSSSSSTSPSDSSSSSPSTPSITYYPSAALAVFSPNPTNKTSLTFSGTAAIEQGTISLVEYTLTEDESWIQAQPVDGSFNGKDEHFTFTTPNLAEGTYTIKARAKSGAGILTQDASYAIQTITIATTPPKVSLDKISPNPTKNQTPTIIGKATSLLVEVSKVEISIDSKSWQIAKQLGNTFSITLNKLEDGNYPILARAFDSAGNIGTSDIQTLIVDTIPPIIGGGVQTLGPQILIPDINGRITIVAGAQTTLVLSMKGGVTKAKIEGEFGSFPLTPQPESNLWFGNLKFDTKGEKQLKISAVDGADNRTERNLNTILVEDFGKVIDGKKQVPIEGAKVSIYFFETQSKQWILWEGESYGQPNPQKTNKEGAYSFMVPAARYYVEVQKPGYNSMQSEILDLSETSIINYKFPLSSKPKLIFNLPIFGEVILTTPSFAPPQTLPSNATASQSSNIRPKITFTRGTPAPKLELPDLNNKKLKLSDFKGKKVFLSFISPWSAQSLEQAAILSKASLKSLSDEKIVAVLLQESIASSETFMKRGNYKFQALVDVNGETAANYKITLLPQNFFIDSEGKIQEVYVGVLSSKQLIEKFKKFK